VDAIFSPFPVVTSASSTGAVVLPRRYFSCHGFSSRKTNCPCARRGFKRTTSSRRYHFIYMNFISSQRATKPSNTQ